MIDPTAGQRITWTNPEAEAGRPTLVTLTADVLTVAAIPKSDLDAAANTISSGAGVTGQVIPVHAITELAGYERDVELVIHFKAAGRTDSVTVILAEVLQRNQLLDALIERLDASGRRLQRSGRWSARFLLLGYTAMMALITWAFHDEAQQLAAGQAVQLRGRNALQQLVHSVIQAVEGFIGPTAVLVIGGILTSIGVLAFLYVLFDPPINIVVEHSPSGRRGQNDPQPRHDG